MSYQPPTQPNQNEPTIPAQPYTQYPPMPPPPPYQQPPPKRPRRTLLWIILGALLLVGIIGYYQSAASQQTGTTTATTQAPIATDTPTPTPAPLTNPTDIKTELQNDANSVLTGDNITADYGEQLSKAVIFETTTTKQPLSFIQNECFNMQKVVWQDQQLSLKIVDFAVATINGQLPNVYGECVLDQASAGKIDWNSTDAVTAWNDKVYQDMTP